MLSFCIHIFEQLLGTIFLVASPIASIFSAKLGEQKFWGRKLPQLPEGKTIFFCSSAGEYKQAEALAKELQKQDSQQESHFFLFSISGKKYLDSIGDDTVGTYSLTPILGYWGWAKFFKSSKPNSVYFVRGELWPGAVATSGALTRNFLINFHKPRLGLLYTKNEWYYRWVFTKFEKVFSVGDVPKSLQKLVCAKVGDTKFDSFKPVSPAKAKFIVCGSVWSEDIEFLFNGGATLEFSHPPVLFPHDLAKNNLDRIEAKLLNYGYTVTQTDCLSSISKHTQKEIFVCTKLGVLRSSYQLAAKAYVGGGLRGAVHNILEPLAYGAPTAIGPKFGNSPESAVFAKTKALTILNSKVESKVFFQKEIAIDSTQCQAIFTQHKGAAKKIASMVLGEQIA